MFPGAFRFFVGGAPAAFDGVAVNLVEERLPAIGDAGADDAQGAALADGGPGDPVG